MSDVLETTRRPLGDCLVTTHQKYKEMLPHQTDNEDSENKDKEDNKDN